MGSISYLHNQAIQESVLTWEFVNMICYSYNRNIIRQSGDAQLYLFRVSRMVWSLDPILSDSKKDRDVKTKKQLNSIIIVTLPAQPLPLPKGFKRKGM